MTRAATARPEEEALLSRPRQAALLTAGVAAVTAVVFALVADHGVLARIQRLDDAWLRLMISGRPPGGSCKDETTYDARAPRQAAAPAEDHWNRPSGFGPAAQLGSGRAPGPAMITRDRRAGGQGRRRLGHRRRPAG
jgi:hypothetical protein